MQSNERERSRAFWARGFAALWAVLAAAAVLGARPAAAAPFAYVTNNSKNVSVIDTATNMVVATVLVGTNPLGVAVAPNGKHAYVANQGPFTSAPPPGSVSVIDTASNTVLATVIVGTTPERLAVAPDGKHVYVTNSNSANVSVIDTTTNMVVATVPVGNYPVGVAVTPDGTHAYVTNNPGVFVSGYVSVIDTATNKVVAAVPVGAGPVEVAITPDGKHAYVVNQYIFAGRTQVSVIDTATNAVVTTVTVGANPYGVAVTPDGKHVYVTNNTDNTVSVIATASNTVVATVAVGRYPVGVAFTPDGKHAYVANSDCCLGGTVSLIDTATNTVEAATIPVGNYPFGVGILPPPPGIPFAAFSAKFEIDFDHKPNEDHFELQSSFTLGHASNGINPAAEKVKLQIGAFTTTIPPGSFKKHEGEDEHEHEDGVFIFHGVIDGVHLKVRIEPTGTKRYALKARGLDANLTGIKNPVPVTLTIGDDTGTTSVKADID